MILRVRQLELSFLLKDSIPALLKIRLLGGLGLLHQGMISVEDLLAEPRMNKESDVLLGGPKRTSSRQTSSSKYSRVVIVTLSEV